MSGSKAVHLTLGVGELVQFSAQSGDLSGSGASASGRSGPTSREGQLGHQQIQQSRGDDWLVEYRLQQNITIANYRVSLRGRVDLMHPRTTPPTIEEIKTTYHPPGLMSASKKQLHWAQAKVYAYLYALERQDSHAGSLPEQLQVAVTWYDLIADKAHTDTQLFNTEVLAEYCRELLHIYISWHQPWAAQQQRSIHSAQQLVWPFADYRPGQYGFARHVYRACRDKQPLLVAAPTGTGKTSSTLFPAMKAYGAGLVDQVLYLITKGSAQQTALKTLHLLRQQGLSIDSMVIQAKAKCCPCRSGDEAQQQSCLAENGKCLRTVGFFDRLPEARLQCLATEELSPQAIADIADTHALCPFELSLQMVRWRSVVICDLNYVFDPMVKLAAFDQYKSTRLVLIDEIHNLPDRARGMYSADISSAQNQLITTQLDAEYKSLQKAIKRLNRQLSALNKLDTLPSKPPKNITDAVAAILEISQSLANAQSAPQHNLFQRVPDGYAEWLQQLYRYHTIALLYGEQHQILLKSFSRKRGKPSSKSIVLQLLCLDPAPFLNKRYQCARAIVGFSATLKPMSFYLRLLGFDEQARTLNLPAAFPVENQLTLRCDYIDTRWQQRDASIAPLVALIAAVANHKPGKYIAFFPSYQYLGAVYDEFTRCYPDISTSQQVAGNDELARKQFLAEFLEDAGDRIGFAILGGVFGEGIDYIGDSLSGAIVIGSGMPQPTEEQKLMEGYFISQGLNGYQYAYQFPGFMRVQQTAGRVIRSATDRGIVILVDPRFQRGDYQALMPSHWQVSGCKSLANLTEKIISFEKDKRAGY